MGIGEEDLTHLPEILDLHDLSKDESAGTKEQFRKRCRGNHLNHAIHQHVSDTTIPSAMVHPCMVHPWHSAWFESIILRLATSLASLFVMNRTNHRRSPSPRPLALESNSFPFGSRQALNNGLSEVGKMKAQDVCAVIVTYRPNAKMLARISYILAQVQGLVVVDNGSNTDERDPLRLASQTIGLN